MQDGADRVGGLLQVDSERVYKLGSDRASVSLDSFLLRISVVRVWRACVDSGLLVFAALGGP